MRAWLFAIAALSCLPAQAAPLKHPIVLVHGATTKGAELQVGFLSFGPYFRHIKELYEAEGAKVFIVNLATDASIGERAAVLKNYLETEPQLKGRSVNLIAHSLGGLDARFVTSVFKSSQVASITTIGTPHRGTPLADWAHRQVKEKTAWYWFFRLIGYDMAQRRFLVELTTDFMAREFNPRVPDRAGVKYYSVRSSASFADGTMSYLLWFPERWLRGEPHSLAGGEGDGMVPLESQGWGQVLFDVRLDHLGQMNHHALRPAKQEELSLSLYRRIYENLAKAGL